MSGYIDNIKNIHHKAILNQIRLANKQRMSICYKCNKSSIGIIAEGCFIYPACNFHTALNETLRDNKDLLDRLGSDYDENGKPYWES